MAAREDPPRTRGRTRSDPTMNATIPIPEKPTKVSLFEDQPKPGKSTKAEQQPESTTAGLPAPKPEKTKKVHMHFLCKTQKEVKTENGTKVFIPVCPKQLNPLIWHDAFLEYGGDYDSAEIIQFIRDKLGNQLLEIKRPFNPDDEPDVQARYPAEATLNLLDRVTHADRAIDDLSDKHSQDMTAFTKKMQSVVDKMQEAFSGASHRIVELERAQQNHGEGLKIMETRHEDLKSRVGNMDLRVRELERAKTAALSKLPSQALRLLIDRLQPGGLTFDEWMSLQQDSDTNEPAPTSGGTFGAAGTAATSAAPPQTVQSDQSTAPMPGPSARPQLNRPVLPCLARSRHAPAPQQESGKESVEEYMAKLDSGQIPLPKPSQPKPLNSPAPRPGVPRRGRML